MRRLSERILNNRESALVKRRAMISLHVTDGIAPDCGIVGDCLRCKIT